MSTYSTIEREFFSSLVSGTPQTPLNDMKRAYYISQIGGDAASVNSLNDLEKQWLRKVVADLGATVTETRHLEDLWRQAVAATGQTPSRFINDNKIKFYYSTLVKNYVVQEGVLFEDFQTVGDWTPSPNNPSQIIAETSDTIQGGSALKVVSTSSSNNQQAIKTISKVFSSGDGDISFWVKPTSNVNYVVLGFSSQTSFASQYMDYRLYSTNMFPDKWNFVRLKLTDFTAFGGDSFSNTMIRMRVRVVSNNGSQATAIFDDLRIGVSHKAKIIMQSDNVGSPSIINTMYPILSTAGMKGTLYVESSLVDVAGKLTLADLQTLYNAGWDLGNHTTDHSDLTTLSIGDAQTNVETCSNYLVSNGFTRAAYHIAYPLGATNDTVNAMLASVGFKTGRKATDKTQIVPVADFYKLEAFTLKAADSLATAKSYIDAAISYGRTAIIMIEGLADSSPATQEWLTSDYQSLVDYISEKRTAGLVDVVTISGWYNGLNL